MKLFKILIISLVFFLLWFILFGPAIMVLLSPPVYWAVFFVFYCLFVFIAATS